MTTWVFGYGSLMCRPSLGDFLGRDLDADEWVLAVVSGYRRLWNAAMDNTRSDPGTRFWAACPDGTRHEGTVTYLGLEEAPASRVNGAMFRVSEPELGMIDKRELRYDRIEVTGAVDVDRAHGRVFTYLPRRDAVDRHRRSAANGTDRVATWYLDRVTGGFADVGPGYLEEYHATTEAVPSPVEELYPHRIPP